ncbi:hypothetical protein ACGFIJ_01585 [Microbispora bryophytorum]|uniref:hypothetical protein n=1 Tax=Microbispora bryophytorum TaxID=1460882 RepID=UPI003718D44A
MAGARALAYQALCGIGAALLGFAAMTVVAALGLAALSPGTWEAASPALVAAFVTAAVSGGPFVLAASPGTGADVLPLGLRAELTVTPLGVAGAGALVLVLALLHGRPRPASAAVVHGMDTAQAVDTVDAGRPYPAAARAIRIVSSMAACLALLALTAAAARGTVVLGAGGLRAAFEPRAQSVAAGGLVRVGLVLLICLALARPTPIRPAVRAAVRAVLGVCAGVALVATLLGVAAALPALPGAGLAVLGAPNAAFGALSATAGSSSASGPGETIAGLTTLMPGLALRPPGAGGPARTGTPMPQTGGAWVWGVWAGGSALAVLAGVLAAVLTPASAFRTPRTAVYAAMWTGLVVAVAVPVLAALSAVSLDVTATVEGRVLPVARLGTDPWEAAWRAVLLMVPPAALLAASGAALAGRVRVLAAHRPVRRA